MATQIKTKISLDINEFVKQLRISAQKAGATAESIKNEFSSKKISIKVDNTSIDNYKKSITGLASSYTNLSNKSKQSANLQKNALAGLIVSGQKGSAAYKKLSKELQSSTLHAKKFDDAMEQVNRELDKTATKGKKTGGAFSSLKTNLGSMLFAGGAIGAGMIAVQKLSQAFKKAIELGSEFQAALADLSAITGVSGLALEKYGAQAQELSNKFGGKATSQLITYKGLLSRLGIEIANTPEAVNSMTESVNLLSKATGLDAAQSMDALTTTMLQFNVDMGDPNKAAGEMAKQMNVLAAAAKEGASEVPEVAEAFKVSGAIARYAGLSFEETAATIEVLARAGLRGAEAGTKFRGVLLGLQKVTPIAEKHLQEYGISMADVQKTLSERGLNAAMQELNTSLMSVKDPAAKAGLLVELFGKQNTVAAQAIMENGDLLSQYTTKLTGTNTAVEQAAVNMDTYAERTARLKAKVENLLIKAFTKLEPILSKIADWLSWLADNSEYLGYAFGIVTGTAILLGASIKTVAEENAELTKSMQDQNAEQIKQTQGRINEIEKSRLLISEYEKLINAENKTAAEKERLYEIQTELNDIYPEAIDLGEDHAKSLAKVKEETGLVGVNMENLDTSVFKLIENFTKLNKKTNRTKEEQAEYKKVLIALKEKYPNFIKGNDNYAKSLETIKKQSGYAMTGLEDLYGTMSDLYKTQAELKIRALRDNVDLVKNEGYKAVSGLFGASNKFTKVYDDFYAKMITANKSGKVREFYNTFINNLENSKAYTKEEIDNLKVQAQKLKVAYYQYLEAKEQKKDLGGSKGGKMPPDGTIPKDPPKPKDTDTDKKKKTELEKLQAQLKKLDEQLIKSKANESKYAKGTKEYLKWEDKYNTLVSKRQAIYNRIKDIKDLIKALNEEAEAKRNLALIDGTKFLDDTNVDFDIAPLDVEVNPKISKVEPFQTEPIELPVTAKITKVDNPLKDLALAFSKVDFASVFENSFDKIDADAENLTEELQKENVKQGENLRAKLNAGEIDYNEYAKNVQKMREQSAEKELTLEKDKTTKIAGYYKAIGETVKQMSGAVNALISKSIEGVLSSISTSTKDTKGVLTSFELDMDNVGEAAGKMGAAVAASFVAGNAEMLASQKLTWKSMLAMLWESVRSAVNILAAQILANYIATWNVLGIALGTAAIISVNLLLAAAKPSGAEKGVIGLTKGYNTKAGKTDTIPMMLAEKESVINAKDSQRETGILGHINKGGSSYEYFKEHYLPNILKENEIVTNNNEISDIERSKELTRNNNTLKIFSKTADRETDTFNTVKDNLKELFTINTSSNIKELTSKDNKSTIVEKENKTVVNNIKEYISRILNNKTEKTNTIKNIERITKLDRNINNSIKLEQETDSNVLLLSQIEKRLAKIEQNGRTSYNSNHKFDIEMSPLKADGNDLYSIVDRIQKRRDEKW